MREWNKFLHHKEGYLLLNQNKNIKIYSIQKTYKIEWHHKVTSYALFTVYDTKFVNQKLFEPTEDIIKTVMKPFRVALISLLFDVIFITHQPRYHQLTTWQSVLLVLFTVLGRCVTSLGCLRFFVQFEQHQRVKTSLMLFKLYGKKCKQPSDVTQRPKTVNKTNSTLCQVVNWW